KAALEKGTAAAKAVGAKVKGLLLGKKVGFDVRGESHELWAENRDGQIGVFVASSGATWIDPKALTTCIEQLRALKGADASGAQKSIEPMNTLSKLNASVPRNAANADALQNIENQMIQAIQDVQEYRSGALERPLNRAFRWIEVEIESENTRVPVGTFLVVGRRGETITIRPREDLATPVVFPAKMSPIRMRDMIVEEYGMDEAEAAEVIREVTGGGRLLLSYAHNQVAGKQTPVAFLEQKFGE